MTVSIITGDEVVLIVMMPEIKMIMVMMEMTVVAAVTVMTGEVKTVMMEMKMMVMITVTMITMIKDSDTDVCEDNGMPVSG